MLNELREYGRQFNKTTCSSYMRDSEGKIAPQVGIFLIDEKESRATASHLEAQNRSRNREPASACPSASTAVLSAMPRQARCRVLASRGKTGSSTVPLGYR